LRFYRTSKLALPDPDQPFLVVVALTTAVPLGKVLPILKLTFASPGRSVVGVHRWPGACGGGTPMLTGTAERRPFHLIIVGAEVDVWHSSTSGLYESQDSEQADMNLRGKFTSDETGTFSFRSIKPAGYPIPTDGNVVGQLLDAQGRHPFRPPHVHFRIFKPGFKTLISQVFMPDDEHLEEDVQFGVTRNLIGNLVRHDEPRSDDPDLEAPWYSLKYTFMMEEGETRLPPPPIG
jgi:hypothetical protein